jgi:hypothetical protein
VAVRTQHQAGPGRRAIVVTDLDSLRSRRTARSNCRCGCPGAALIAASTWTSPRPAAGSIRPCCARHHGDQTSPAISTAGP